MIMRSKSTSQFGRSVLAILSFMLLFSGCGLNDGAPPTTYSITGKVYIGSLDDDPYGWPDVTVSIEDAQGVVSTTTTDNDGNYRFSVPDGHYSITPSSAGLTFYLSSDEVDVAGGQQAGIDFKVNPVMAGVVAKTSTTPKEFKSTRLPYTSNVAFNTFADYANESMAITIPGLIQTAVGSDTSKTMVPQGLAFADKYVLISAYDSAKTMNSVIYVVSKEDKTFKTVLSLPNKDHLGGIAFDGENIWVCGDKALNVIKYSDLESYVENDEQSQSITFKTSVNVGFTTSFATYYNGRVFTGTFNQTDTDSMYGYDVVGKASETPTLTRAIKMVVPEKTQGVAFRESDGLMIVSTSYGRLNYATLRFYKPSWSEVDSSTVALVHKNDAVKNLTVPPMTEGIVIDGDYTYVLFESGAAEYADGASYCVYPINRVLPFWTYGVVK